MIVEDQHIEHIIEACKQQDIKAQEALYRSYYKAMMNLCIRYTNNDTDAMSALNMGFLKVFKNIQRYDSTKATLYTWIRTVVINSCLDYIKINKQQPYQEINDVHDIQIEPEVISKMKEGVILDLVKKLPPATQAVFNLYIMEGYSHKEIAALLHISEGTSKWHLSEAKKTLKTQIISNNILE